jgi:hypothetical protein
MPDTLESRATAKRLEHSVPLPTAADIGLTRKDVHEARTIRDAEQADPVSFVCQ